MQPMPNLTLIDTEVLYDFYGERSPEMLRDVLSAFRGEALIYFADLQRYLQSDNHYDCRRRFHSLKTMTRMIGATGLSALCSELEQSDLSSPQTQPRLILLLQLWQQLQAEMDLVLYGTAINQ